VTKRMSYEMFRRRRLGDIRRLLLDRCRGRVLPDDDAGREYLIELLKVMSLGRDPRQGMILAANDYAPWLQGSVEDAIDAILDLPTNHPRRTAKDIGERMRVTNEERERLDLRTMHPVDMTAEQMAEQRKAKDRARKRKRYKRSRAEYLATSISRQKPWDAEGISRASWYRRQRDATVTPHAETSQSSIKEHIPGRTCLTGTPAHLEGSDGSGVETGSAPFMGAPSPSTFTLNPNKKPRQSAPPEAEPQAKRTDLCHQAKRTHPMQPQWEKWEGAKWTRT
jgi:hypothetical protein